MKFSVPEQAIVKMHECLENAESYGAYFIREAEPKDDQAEAYVQYMTSAREELRRYIKKWEKDFYEITEGLPEEPDLPEDDWRENR